MQYLNVDYQDLNINEEICLTIGNFDGIHKGHNKILEKLKQEASSLNIKSAILSFDPHPNFYFNDIQRFLINTKQKKIHILKEKKIDYLIDLNFNQELTQLTYSDFENKILLDNLKLKKILIGNDFSLWQSKKRKYQNIEIFL